jgi:DNA polymerase-3 subunit delta'
MQEKLGLWLDWWRDLLLLKTGCGALPTNVDQMKVLNDMAGGYTLIQIRDSIESIRSASEQLRFNVNPQLVLETLMLNIPENVMNIPSRVRR